MLQRVLNVASVPRVTRAAGPGRAQWTALPGAWAGGVPPLLSPASLCINSCLQTKCPQKLQTSDSNPTFHEHLIYGEACQLLAEYLSLLCLDQHSSHAAASNLWPKEPTEQGDSNLKVLMKEMMVQGQRMAGALGRPGNPDTSLQSSFRRQALPLTEPSTRLRGLAQSASWSVPPDWMNRCKDKKNTGFEARQSRTGFSSHHFHSPWSCGLTSPGLQDLICRELWSK